MRFLKAKKELKEKLKDLYDEREAENITKIYFEDLFSLNPGSPDRLMESDEIEIHQECSKRLLEGEPLAYVTGKAVFYGLELEINNSVLIPRPETEELIYWILEDYAFSYLQLDVLDIGTGSGCIALTLKRQKPNFRIFGIEISLDALNVARLNAKRLNIPVQIMRVDILDEELWPLLGKMDLIVSNPPYIHENEKQLLLKQVVDYEPALALFVSDEDPIIYYKRIAGFAKKHLNPGGKLYFEISEFNAQQIITMLKEKGFKNITLRQDLQEKDRLIRAEL